MTALPVPEFKQSTLLEERDHKDIVGTEVKVLDEVQGIVEAIVSVTNVIDDVNDIIEPGAYADTLKKRLPKGVWCADETTEILTQRGWLRYDEVTTDDEAYVLDADRLVARFERIQAVNIFDAEPREVRLVETGGFSSLTTLNHRWPVRYRGTDKVLWRTTEQLGQGHGVIRALPRSDAPSEAKWTDAFVALVAWFWNEGNVETAGTPRITITQSPSANWENCVALRALLDQAFPGGWREQPHRPSGCSQFRLNKGPTEALLAVCGTDKAPTPEFIRSLTAAQLRLLIDTCLAGDGHVEASGTARWAQRSEHSLRMFEMAAALAGIPTNTRPKTGEHYGRPVSTVTLLRRRTAKPFDALTMKTGARVAGVDERRVHDGIVWCPTTPSGTWLARRNGSVYFTGNSHDWDNPIAKTLDAVELMPGDPRLPAKLQALGAGGLKVRMQFNMETQAGREAFSNVKFYEDHAEWSIGYVVPVGAAEIDTKTGIRRIKSLDLFEYSPVLFGANSHTVTLDVKKAAAETADGSEAGQCDAQFHVSIAGVESSTAGRCEKEAGHEGPHGFQLKESDMGVKAAEEPKAPAAVEGVDGEEVPVEVAANETTNSTTEDLSEGLREKLEAETDEVDGKSAPAVEASTPSPNPDPAPAGPNPNPAPTSPNPSPAPSPNVDGKMTLDMAREVAARLDAFIADEEAKSAAGDAEVGAGDGAAEGPQGEDVTAGEDGEQPEPTPEGEVEAGQGEGQETKTETETTGPTDSEKEILSAFEGVISGLTGIFEKLRTTWSGEAKTETDPEAAAAAGEDGDEKVTKPKADPDPSKPHAFKDNGDGKCKVCGKSDGASIHNTTPGQGESAHPAGDGDAEVKVDVMLTGSFEDTQRRLYEALQGNVPKLADDSEQIMWIEATFADHVLVYSAEYRIGEADAEGYADVEFVGARYLTLEYAVTEGAVRLGDATEVEVSGVVTAKANPVDEIATKTIEGIESKVGRTLSASNAEKIKGAVQQLIDVLSQAGVDFEDKPAGEEGKAADAGEEKATLSLAEIMQGQLLSLVAP